MSIPDMSQRVENAGNRGQPEENVAQPESPVPGEVAQMAAMAAAHAAAAVARSRARGGGRRRKREPDEDLGRILAFRDGRDEVDREEPEVRDEEKSDTVSTLVKMMSEQHKRITELTNVVAATAKQIADVSQKPPPLILPSKCNWATTERNARQLHAINLALSGVTQYRKKGEVCF
jgi:hypothetical protein